MRDSRCLNSCQCGGVLLYGLTGKERRGAFSVPTWLVHRCPVAFLQVRGDASAGRSPSSSTGGEGSLSQCTAVLYLLCSFLCSSGSSFSGVAASSCAPLLLSSGAGAALVTSLPPPPPPPVSASNPAASRASYSGSSTLDSVLLSPSNRGPLSGSSVALNSAVPVPVAAASGQVPPPPPPPPPPPLPSHVSSVPLAPHQGSPLSCCSLPSHPPYPLRTENQTGAQQQLPRSSDASVGVEAAGGRGAATSTNNAGPVSFLTGSSLAAFQHHLRTAQLSSVVGQGQAGGGGGQSSNATLFGQHLPPHDLQQLLLLLPPEKQQLLLQETSGGPGVSTGRGGVETPASAAGAPSMVCVHEELKWLFIATSVFIDSDVQGESLSVKIVGQSVVWFGETGRGNVCFFPR